MVAKELNFNDLPEAIGEIYSMVAQIQTILGVHSQSKIDTDFYSEQKSKIENDWFNLDELIAYHPDKPAKATVYGWITDKKIPYTKSGKKLRFLKSEIDEWLLQGRRKTHNEIEMEAKQYIKNKKNYKF